MKKLKSYIYWFLLTVPFIVLALYGLIKTPDMLPVFSVENRYSTEEISVYDAKDGNLYVFLPSYADMTQVTVGAVSGRSVFLGETQITDGMDCSAFQLKTPYPLTVNNKKVGNLWFYKSANTAALYINTASQSMEKIHADKNTAEMSDIRIFTRDGILNYHGPNSTLKGRGNSSWKSEKKPYTITLESSEDILNLGSSVKWVLLANYTDETGLRNKLVFDYAAALGKYSGWSPSSAFVDLYLNGQYVGLYLLCQKIEVSSDFLNLGSIDYLMELMWANRSPQASSTFNICPTRTVEIVYPSNCTATQADALQTYVSEFQEALFAENGICKASGKSWSDYIDIDSWARKYLIEELFSNFDVGQASQFFWLNAADNKLYAGPCWDYDLTFGKQWNTDWSSPCSLLALRDWQNTPSWFGALWKKDAFRDHVIFLYTTEFRPLLAAFPGNVIPNVASEMADSISMNGIRWANDLPYEDGVSQMIQYLDARIAFLDSLWIAKDSYCAITLQTQETYNLYIPRGTVCSTLPQPEDLRASGIWYDQNTGQPFNADSPIFEDITLVAKKPNTPPANQGKLSLSSKEFVIILSVAALFVLFLCLSIADFSHRRKERRNANEQSRS